MNKNRVVENALLYAAPTIVRIGIGLVDRYVNNLEVKAKAIPASSDVKTSESSKRHHQYRIERIEDMHLRPMFEGCNKAIDQLENGNYSMSLFEIRKVMEHVLVLVIENNQMEAAASYRSAKNLKICKRNNFLDDETADAISRCREICSDNTHQLGYESMLTRSEAEYIVESICRVLETIANVNEPVYQA